MMAGPPVSLSSGAEDQSEGVITTLLTNQKPGLRLGTQFMREGAATADTDCRGEELGVRFQSEMDVCVLFECSLYFDLHRQRKRVK